MVVRMRTAKLRLLALAAPFPATGCPLSCPSWDAESLGGGEAAAVTLARDSTTVGTLDLQDVLVAPGDCPVSGATVQVAASWAFDPDVVAATTVGRPCG